MSMVKNKVEEPAEAGYLGDRWRDAGALTGFEADIQQGPALFLAAVAAAGVGAALAYAFLCYMVAPRLAQFWGPLPTVMAAAGAAAFLYGAAEWLAVVATLKTRRDLLLPLARWGRAIVKLAPLAQRLSAPLGSSRDRMVHSLVETWNGVARVKPGRHGRGPVLVLLPRCIQRPECQQPLTQDADNCRRCGLCGVADILSVRDEYGDVVVAVLTGGSLVRGVVRECLPRAVVGVACERELLDGIAVVGRIPVMGVANQRPLGPCRGTEVRIEELRAALDAFHPPKRKG